MDKEILTFKKDVNTIKGKMLHNKSYLKSDER